MSTTKYIIDNTNGSLAGQHVQGNLSATTFFGDGGNLTNIVGVDPLVVLTKSEIDDLIEGSNLVPGQSYMILSADTSLYGGTNIILKAVTDSRLSSDGHGVFYNPKYESGSIGSGIWNKFMSPSMSAYQFFIDEPVLTDNGASGIYRGQGFIEWLGGEWSGATSMTGLTSLETSYVNNASTPMYYSGDSVIWGGRKWILTSEDQPVVELAGTGNDIDSYFEYRITGNTLVPGTFQADAETTGGTISLFETSFGYLTGDGYGNITYDSTGAYVQMQFSSAPYSGGNVFVFFEASQVGCANDEFNLNSNWTAVPYNETDYQIATDEIIYDYEHDMIVGRKDKYGNEVSCSYQTIRYIEEKVGDGGMHPIRNFQWGNVNPQFEYKQTRYNFSDEPDNDDDSINDGGEDMYDGANAMYTQNGVFIPYTHSRFPFYINDGGWPDQSYKMDGSLADGTPYFSGTSQYFTNLYPSLFVMMADNVSIDSFKVDGNIGSDGYGLIETDSYDITGYSQTYGVFVKKVYRGAETAQDEMDPSINHIYIVNTSTADILHDWDTSTDYDFDQISNLSGVTWISYLLTSEWGGTFSESGGQNYISKSTIDSIVTSFLDVVDGQTLSDSLSLLNGNYQDITSHLPDRVVPQFYGVYGNIVKDGIIDCINFLGGRISQNVLNPTCSVFANTFAPDFYSRISDNDMHQYSEISYNTISKGGEIKDNTVSNGIIGENNLGTRNGEYASVISKNTVTDNSEIRNNILSNSDIYRNDIIQGSDITDNEAYDSNISNNSLAGESTVNDNFIDDTNILKNNLDAGSEINNNQFFEGYFEHNTIKSSNVINSLFGGFDVQHNSITDDSEINDNFFGGFTFRYNNIEKYSFFSFNEFYNTTANYNNILFDSEFNDNYSNGSYMNYNTVEQNSFFTGNHLSNDSSFYMNTVKYNSSITNNELYDYCSIDYNELYNDSYLQNNVLNSDCLIYKNRLDINSLLGYNNLSEASEIYRNTVAQNSSINNNQLTSGSLYDNNVSQVSYIGSNTIEDSSIFNNTTIDDSNISSNSIGNDSGIRGNRLYSSSFISSNSMDDSALVENLIESESYISSNSMYNQSMVIHNAISLYSDIRNNQLSGSTLSKNRLYDSEFWFQAGYPTASGLTKIDARNVRGNFNVISASTIFQNFPKQLFVNLEGGTRVSYYDAGDLLVVSNITT